MKYRLKLNKSKMYHVAVCYGRRLVVLPTMRSCIFKQYGRVYWLSFSDEMGYLWKITIQRCCGKVSIWFRNLDTGDSRMMDIDDQWLFDGGMLEEVA